jgi:hypothetical protein
MKKLIFILVLISLVSCRTEEQKCLKIAMEFSDEFETFLRYKYDNIYYNGYQPKEWILVKENCPDIYNKYILSKKVIWDSLLMVPREKTIIEGMTSSEMMYKLKLKEMEKNKVKVKKSDDVSISQDHYVLIDTLKSKDIKD